MQDWWTSFFQGPYQRIQLPGGPNERTSEEADFLVEALRIEPGAALLDVPCGAGRHAIELAGRGFRPSAVDFNPQALELARARAAERGVEVDFREGDMRALELEQRYAAGYCYFGSFGYFGDADNLAFLRAVAEALEPGGRFLVETHVAESLLPVFRQRDWVPLDDAAPGWVVFEERSYDLERARVESAWTLLGPEGQREQAQLSVRVYTYRELRELFLEAGFAEVEGLESLSGRPFRVGARRLSMVGLKA